MAGCGFSEVIRRANLQGFGGTCGVVAIAINRVIFGGQGTLIAATNDAVSDAWRADAGWDTEEEPFLGHVGVYYKGRIYDAEGLKPSKVFRSYGIVEPFDPDFGNVDEKAARRTRIATLDEFGDDPEVVALQFTGTGSYGNEPAKCVPLRQAEAALRRAIRDC